MMNYVVEMKPDTPLPDHSAAIIGMAGMFANSRNLKEYWRTLVNGIDGISDPPDSHRQLNDYFDADPQKPDHIYCKRGGFLPAYPFDPTEFGIPPASLEATDTSQLLGLVAAKMALADAGYGEGREFDREKTSVVIGVTGTQELVISLGSRLGHPHWRRALEAKGLSDAQKDAIIDEIADNYVPWQENSFPGLLGNVVAGRICNRLNLGGTNCVVDAACASSLSAIHLALMELQTGKSNMVITGGVDTINDIFMHMCFSKTGVLSHTGDARPFSADADGTVLGEGIGIVVLKRLADAQRDNDRIYAVIRGIGSSSDGKSQSIYAPRAAGQVRALKEAYRNADVAPGSIGMVEAHGTGTRVGDEVEFSALKTVFAAEGDQTHRCCLGAVKSMIGHTKAAAGAAGLIKAALSLYNKVLPPTLKVDRPDPKLNIEDSPFYLNNIARPWFSGKKGPRRSGVSSFGFGGSNFHMVLEEYDRQKKVTAWDGSVELFAFSGNDASTIVEKLDLLIERLDKISSPATLNAMAMDQRSTFKTNHSRRVILVVQTSNAIAGIKKICQHARQTVKTDQTTWLPDKGIYFFSGTDHLAKVAFMFPGQGSQYVHMGNDLACRFPQFMQALEAADKAFDSDVSLAAHIYPESGHLPAHLTEQEATLRKTHVAQPAIGAVSLGMLAILEDFNIRPSAVCGHSYGELPALHAAGRIDKQTLLQLSVTRGRLMAQAGKDGQAGTMLAVKAPIQELKSMLGTMPGTVLANINSPEQGVLAGSKNAIAAAREICADKGYRCVALPVAAAFHSPLVQSASEPFASAVKSVSFEPGGLPVYANVTAAPYPDDPSACADLLSRQMTSTVNFRGIVEKLRQDGVNVFVEVGPKTVLSGLVRATIGTDNIYTIAMDRSAGKQSGMLDLGHAIGQLAALGVKLDLKCWETALPADRSPKMVIPLSGANYRTPRQARPSEKTPPGKPIASTPDRQRPAVRADRRPKASPDFMNSQQHPQNEASRTPMPQTPPPDGADRHPTNIDTTLAIVQKGLESIQALQHQTAQAHQTFLETQAQASRTLQEMVQSTRSIFLSAGAHPVSGVSRQSQPVPAVPPAPPEPQPFFVPDAATPSPLPEPEPILQEAALAPETEDRPADPTRNTQPVDAENDGSEVSKALLAVVAELTGYPVEMLGLDMDIEADLGIDSIKRVEILSAMEERMPHLPQVTPDMVGTLKTLGQICDFLSQAETEPAVEPAPASPAEASPEKPCGSARVARRVMEVADTPATPKREVRFGSSGWVGVLDDRSALAAAIASNLEKRNIPTRLISVDAIADAGTFADIAGWILTSQVDAESAFLSAKHAADALKKAALAGDALFASVTCMDGAFGFTGKHFERPGQGALPGLVKTAALEWETITCRAIDLAPELSDPDDAARAVVTELLQLADDDPVEIGLGTGRRIQLKPIYAESVEDTIEPIKKGVFVITGGARGVTAACARSLAESTGASIALVGRSERPFAVPAWLDGLHGEAKIKRAIAANAFADTAPTPKDLEAEYRRQIANRDILGTLQELQATGVSAAYFSADVTNMESLNMAIDAVRAELGPIGGLIHGAGVLRDRLIVDKSIEQFRQVYATKVDGFKNLLAATSQDPIRHMILFSSVAARTGNIGQCDYAMANETLNKMAWAEAAKRPECRVAAINWGPWDGGMVTPSLKKVFQSREVPLIPLETGAEMMVAEIQQANAGPVEVLIGSMLSPKQEAGAQTEGVRWNMLERRELDLNRYPVLASHVIGGKPVVPFALMTEWIGHGALKENPGFSLHGIDDFRLLSGIRIEKERKLVRLMAGAPRKSGNNWEVDIELRNGVKDGKDVIHSRARALLVDRLPDAPAFSGNGKNGHRPYPRQLDDVYAKILFHGDQLRAIKSIIDYSDHGMTAQLVNAPKPEAWMQDPIRERWTADPMVLDGAFQMAIVWCFEQTGKVCLPSYARSYRQYRTVFPSSGVMVAMAVNSLTNHKLVADFTFLDEQQRVVATLSGYEATIDESLIHSFHKKELSIVIKEDIA
ncbi:MAG: hypothetical protein CSA23_00500 [Deltaproteobacteria bacterium]|nr:MAG: hypothetical protein CSA23_00500 [Deltaproteobacteria bacterium]